MIRVVCQKKSVLLHVDAVDAGFVFVGLMPLVSQA
jgi:cysteine sulfinate desulfinase/cysteine desulfurase-like protein